MVKMPIKIYLGDRRFEHQTEENQTSNEKMGGKYETINRPPGIMLEKK